jgi:LuxR family maltose regulon positive regulatory protein
MDLVGTKLEPPLDPGNLVDRPRLLRRLQEVHKVPLTVIQTPAGYGKTSLLSQWFAALKKSGHRVGWLSIDASDRDAMSFLSYIAAALSAGGVHFEPAIEQASAADIYTAPKPFITALMKSLEQSSEPFYLFLDDVHLLSSIPHNTLCRLIDRIPPSMHFIMSSRVVPDLHLARTRARGQLLEMHVDDLKFTAQEAHQFMAVAGSHDLDESELSTLDERTEGWIAGIKLASLALRGGVAPKELLASFTGSRRSVSEFFAEEVVSLQPAEVREFLLKTSVLDRLCPALCNEVTGRTDSRQILNLIEESGLFLLHLDDERNWYRYHHLFSEFLQRRLSDEEPGADTELHLRASRWFWSQDSYVESVEHALKGHNPGRAAELLELRCQDMTYAGKLWLVSKFAARIPEAVLFRYPRVLLGLAWMLTRNLRFEQTRKLLDTVNNLLTEFEATRQLPADELRHLRYLLLHRQMMLAAAQDDAPLVEQQCKHLIEDFPEDSAHPYLSGTIYAQLLYAQREQYRLDDLERLRATVQGVITRSSYNFASIALQASIGPSLHFAGKTDAARRALEQGLAEGIRFGGPNSALAALPALPLSELLYESNELDGAEKLIEDTLAYATDYGFVDQLMPGFITHARIKRARGDLAGAFQGLDEGMAIAAERKLERLRFAVVAERVKFLIQDGRTDDATRYARAAGISHSSESMMPKTGVTTRDEFRASAWFRIALAEDRVSDALGVSKNWRNFCAARGATRSLIRWDILIAQALFISGDVRTAQRTLREAIAHASVSRLVRSFIDEGPVIHTLLASTYEANLQVLHPTDAFSVELLEIFEASTHKHRVRPPTAAAAEGLYGKLSVKEREILELVSSGMRNREVATKLGMTEGSIKWYMQQVYDKVGTRRRLQAVERARQFGLIA